MRSGKKRGISRKTLTAVIIFTLIIMVLTCIGGSIIFDRAIERLYNKKGYIVANIVLAEIDHDKIAQYAKTFEADEYYDELVEYMHKVEEYSEVRYIYIAVPYEDRTMRYVYDTDTFIGDSDPISAKFDEVWKVYTTGEKPDSYMVRHSKKYGYLTSSCLPVIDSSGNIAALLFVDTQMEVILSTLLKFIINMVLVSLVLLTLFCILHWHFLHKYLISPLVLIRDDVKKFASDNDISEDRLKEIKTGDELEDLADSVSFMKKEIVDYIEDIKAITAEKERIDAELNVAKNIQADMLPSIYPDFSDIKEFDLFATMDPAKEVGGDFFDFFYTDENHLALVLADVSGKGIPASLFMVVAKTLIKHRTLTGKELSPAMVLEDVNNRLCERNHRDMFVTVWFAIIDLRTGKGVAANAGHEHPAVKRKDSVYELDVYKHSLAVAAMEGVEFSQHEFELNPGDSIFIYTDGVPEATSSEVELFGSERMLKALNSKEYESQEEVLKGVKDAIDEFVGEADQFDDITMLGFKYYGPEGKIS